MLTLTQIFEYVRNNVVDAGRHYFKTMSVSSATYDEETDETRYTVNSYNGFSVNDRIYNVTDGVGKILRIKRISDFEGDGINYLFVDKEHLFEVGSLLIKADGFIFIDNAIVTLSMIRSVPRVESGTADNTNIVDLPEDFDIEQSAIQEIEYPVNQMPKQVISKSNYSIELIEENSYKLVFNAALQGEYKIRYLIPHFYTLPGPDNEDPPEYNYDPETSVDYSWLTGFGDLACAYYCFALSTLYTQATNPTIPADVTDYREKHDQYLRLYKYFLSRAGGYFNIDLSRVQTGDESVKAASVSQERNFPLSTARDFLTTYNIEDNG